MRILHIITGLDDGGSENVLYRLCKSDSLDQHYVISLTGSGKYNEMLKQIGVQVYTLQLNSIFTFFFDFIRLTYIIHKLKPDVIQCWMYHANVIGGAVARLLGYKSVFWSIRNSGKNFCVFHFFTKLTIKIGALFSSFIPYRIITCSLAAIDPHVSIGYERRKFVFIPNGYDITRFQVSNVQVKQYKAIYSRGSFFPILGMVARLDPSKDHENLIQALFLLKKENIQFKTLLIGNGLSNENHFIVNLIDQFHLRGDVILLGPQSDISLWMQVMDIHVLSSSAEAFPNVLAEAMLSGTPCVATDVGDAKFIVGDTGWVVPPKNPSALAEAIMVAIEEWKDPQKWSLRRESARKRIMDNYTIDKMITSYRRIWMS
ncbi:glycosyltransferase family 4 protein [Thermoflavifilum thermophilum]|uniref:Glycosyltransferase involved in cell wall bisynthesis n=1 Tax=Thermoflavifilum thermophilum TaxID=1393122 RepID=A0A1I7MYG8_9BACT|nr:glycosyltransferase [Thermoflavifilum thermophilum]SFV27385.1 Glycosyltransferase involved in cell wall bisynthesis [Thermoflavifilum thermophilum]